MRVSALLAFAFVAAAGCTSYVKRGSALYSEGRYIEAAEVFERTEHRLRRADHRDCAQYALFRGMTLLALGDLRNAERWLTYAYQVNQSRPGSLKLREQAILDRGWYDLGQRLHPSRPTVSPPLTSGDSPAIARPDALAGDGDGASHTPPTAASRLPLPSDRSAAAGAPPGSQRGFVRQNQ